MRLPLLLALFNVMAFFPALPADSPANLTAQGVVVPAATLDALFARWDHPDTPGAALAVISDGKVVYRRGYGLADLDHGAPITPQTPFHVASLSKQFTACAVLLLAQEGRLSLDDDVRGALPKLHDFGRTMTLRHLLHHTSGLRDQWDLLLLSGWRLQDLITQEDVLGRVWRQRTLNFPPGEEYSYSNTGYTLLAEGVRRVSGMPFKEFARQRIFEPLGMTSTRFHDNPAELIPGRALSYSPTDAGGYGAELLNLATVGATGLWTTLDDMAKWDANFNTGRVGGPKLIAAMTETGRLNSGAPISYAAGLDVGVYRGWKRVIHTGADAAYRACYLRFPTRRLSVILLGNAADLPVESLAFAVADLFLPKADGPLAAPKLAKEPTTPPAPPKTAKKDRAAGKGKRPRALNAYAGDYTSDELEAWFSVVVRDNALRLTSAKLDWPLTRREGDAFEFPGGVITFTGGARRRISGFTLSMERSRNLRFRRAARPYPSDQP